MHDAVDEQRRGAANLAAGEPALDVPADAGEHAGARAVGVEAVDVEPELGRAAAQVVVLQRSLAVEQQGVHLPEAVLQRGRLGGRRGGKRVRMDLRQREVAEREAHAIPDVGLDALDFPERAARVRTLVVAILDDQPTGRPTPDMVDRGVERRHARPVVG
jgi:hypothetical protein